MLPTKGFFKDIDCPYHERSCGRPYCHFRHRKKQPESDDLPTAAGSSVPTYKPTPKSELAASKSHLPISYVPDMVRASTRSSYDIKDRPTYKPTPKSVLSNVLPMQTVTTYTPTPIIRLQEEVGGNQLNLEDYTREFELIDEILNDADHQDEEENKSQGDSISKEDEQQANGKQCEVKSSPEKGNDKDKSRDRHKHSKSRDKHKDREKVTDKTKKSSKTSTHKESKTSSKSSSSSSSKIKVKEDGHRKDKYRRSSTDSNATSTSRKHQKASDKHKDSDKHCKQAKDCSKTSLKSKHDTDSGQKHEKDELKASKHDVNDLSDDDDIEADTEFNDDADDLDNLMIEDECFKIFNEYKPPAAEKPKAVALEVTKPLLQAEDAEYLQTTIGKKRIAYSNAASAKEDMKSRPVVKHINSVGLTLQNRIRIARQAQAANEAQDLMREMKDVKRQMSLSAAKASSPPPPKKSKPNGMLKSSLLHPLPSTSLIDDIISGRSTSTMKPMRRIAPVSNMHSLQKAKARIDEMKRSNAANASKTIAHTVSKGATRAAHVPDTSLANIPDVLNAQRSKLPVNVRTRYLCLLADECMKIYIAPDDAYARALNEEYKCYERCSALATYRNSAMLAVNRLRKEAQERDAAGLGPMQIGERQCKKGDSLMEGKKFYDLIKGFLLSDEELVLHGFPREGPTAGRAVINKELKQMSSEHLEPNQRICCRCHKLYLVNREGFPLFEEECCYHPLRKRTIRGERTYLCCKSSEDTGCVMSNTHVSEVSADRELEGFQSTFASDVEDDPRNFAVYALDCEMCYTTKGLELTRVTIVDTNLKTVYESLVKPFNPIIDYNTRFSGITQEQMDKTSTSILQIQANILHLCTAKTILIGHSLESDLKALKIIHNSVVDTSVMFPHKFGLPHKRALRVLASDYLKKIIQNDVAGHDSAEDALAAMELVVWKIKEDLKVKGIKH